MPELRKVRPDAATLKALAHPVRLRMLGLLRLEGPDTATGLAERMGLNSGATSYHLRQLEKHGLIEQDTERGNKRERWWMAAHDSTVLDVDSPLGTPEAEAGFGLIRSIVTLHIAQIERAMEVAPTLPAEWWQASTSSDATVRLTAAEAKDLNERMYALLAEAKEMELARQGAEPDGARPYTVLLHGFPYVGLTE
ncbi:winged helix-turn-helix domain-containing protein [Pelagovum pacificum]|uniref:Helix-turn-helix transcriptional regulator n=1 Tax=Pelagovum pacificum TaxID=2588711 RepID=A0A5C5GEV8_9RHOB|nr:helix-turn-helix domain-containing protein [Pelagovum pacificum]QQA44403.1 helix-turn-helix transcriptional regulator [Pelagovum pacificum]TNY32481.1 helix-turn-helix transcriptional regulator [Pelagovum pacificum]